MKNLIGIKNFNNLVQRLPEPPNDINEGFVAIDSMIRKKRKRPW
jgi:hypothetical protein